MKRWLPGPLIGASALLLTLLNTLFWVIPIIPLGLIKAVSPPGLRARCNRALNWICTTWANGNKLLIDLLIGVRWEIEAPEDLSMNEWYLVVANHQSWADILALQYALNDVIPYFRFFLKKELKWVPLLNVAWWALDYPYMTRYSKQLLEKHPELKGKDIETTKQSCEKFRDTPVSIMNFVEGTRFREDKHERQQSPYRHLLKPNAGGIAFVLSALGDQLTALIDVTIAYPEGRREIWDFMCGRVPAVKIKIAKVPLSDEMMGDYFNDEAFKSRFQSWLNRFWADKDRTLEHLLAATRA